MTPEVSAQEIQENTELAKALRSVEGQIIIEHIERMIFNTMYELVCDSLTVDDQLLKAQQLQTFGKILRGYDERVKAVLNLAARRMTRGHMHAGQQ